MINFERARKSPKFKQFKGPGLANLQLKASGSENLADDGGSWWTQCLISRHCPVFTNNWVFESPIRKPNCGLAILTLCSLARYRHLKNQASNEKTYDIRFN